MEGEEDRDPGRAHGGARRGDREDPRHDAEDLRRARRLRFALQGYPCRKMRRPEGGPREGRHGGSGRRDGRSGRWHIPRGSHDEADRRARNRRAVRDPPCRHAQAALRRMGARRGPVPYHRGELPHSGSDGRRGGTSVREHKHTEGRREPGRVRHRGPAPPVQGAVHRRPHLHAPHPLVAEGAHEGAHGPRRLHQRMGRRGGHRGHPQGGSQRHPRGGMGAQDQLRLRHAVMLRHGYGQDAGEEHLPQRAAVVLQPAVRSPRHLLERGSRQDGGASLRGPGRGQGDASADSSRRRRIRRDRDRQGAPPQRPVLQRRRCRRGSAAHVPDTGQLRDQVHALSSLQDRMAVASGTRRTHLRTQRDAQVSADMRPRLHPGRAGGGLLRPVPRRRAEDHSRRIDERQLRRRAP